QLLQWDGTDWVYITEADITVTEVDGIIGNEVTDATDATLQLNGTGTNADPLTLDVAPLGITDAELAAGAVTLPKMAPGTTAGQLLQWDGTDWVYITEADITGFAGTETGSIFFAAPATFEPIENNAAFFWDNTNNVLGIGTNTPDTANNIKLHVIGATRSGGFISSDGGPNFPSYRFDSDPNTGMFWGGAADQLAFSVGGNEALRIREEGTTDSEIVINGSLELTEQLLDENGNTGNEGDVLRATSTGTEWSAPQIVAMGKYVPSSANNLQGATVTGSAGNYQVILNNPIASADYIIQLTVENTYTINFANQTADTFDVIITKTEGGAIGSPLPQWFFTISDF
ncbi:MAG: hypothetical protein V7670_17375, partial [Maribacter arcticus]|uniref:hypothetical protein n=2 Tax=Maribacter arcticus TaxID=561365 RepID=UPI0030019A94